MTEEHWKELHIKAVQPLTGHSIQNAVMAVLYHRESTSPSSMTVLFTQSGCTFAVLATLTLLYTKL